MDLATKMLHEPDNGAADPFVWRTGASELVVALSILSQPKSSCP